MASRKIKDLGNKIWPRKHRDSPPQVSKYLQIEPPTGLCATCQSLNLSPEKFEIQEFIPTTREARLEKNNLAPVKLGFLHLIFSRCHTCAFCYLVCHAILSSGENTVGDTGLDPDGNHISCRVEWQLDSRAATGSSETRRLLLSTSCPLIPPCYIMPIAQADRIQTTGSGKKIENRADLALLGQWFQACLQHKGCKPQGGDRNNVWPARLIDVSDPKFRVIETPPGEVQYAALSYVWGRSTPIMLTLETYDALMHDGLFDKDLSLVIRNAFSVTRSLGIRFIWVDALCIIQDAYEDKLDEIMKMDRIYGNATVTLCAATGEAKQGISGVDSVPRHPKQFFASFDNFRVTNVYPVADLVASTRWDSRAWTFQERLLSRRCVVFTNSEMIWQCREATWREAVISPLSDGFWTLDSIHSPLKVMNENPLRQYASCVEIYSAREMTFEGDKLKAFEGLGQNLTSGLHSGMIYGLPRRYFDWAVLWEPRGLGSRIREFPSWSWSGWNHGVEWRVSMLSGVIFNLHAWLRTRTWVVWYCAEGGSWELVWDSGKQPPAFFGGRWEGYLSGQGDPYGRSLDDIEEIISDVFKPDESAIILERLSDPPSLRASFGEGFLGLTTFTGTFQLSETNLTSSEFSSKLGEGLCRFGITDKAGDWCGTVVLPSTQSREGLLEFAAISTASDFSMDELDTWNYYIPEERGAADWYCFYALMIEPVDNVYERVGLAKIFRSAFRTGSFDGAVWKTIILR